MKKLLPLVIIGLFACKPSNTTSSIKNLDDLASGGQVGDSICTPNAPDIASALAKGSNKDLAEAYLHIMSSRSLDLVSPQLKINFDNNVLAYCRKVWSSQINKKTGYVPQRLPWKEIPGCFELKLKPQTSQSETSEVESITLTLGSKKSEIGKYMARVLGYLNYDIIARLVPLRNGKSLAFKHGEEAASLRQIKDTLSQYFMQDMLTNKQDLATIAKFLNLQDTKKGVALMIAALQSDRNAYDAS